MNQNINRQGLIREREKRKRRQIINRQISKIYNNNLYTSIKEQLIQSCLYIFIKHGSRKNYNPR
jgi:hypothetical protein